MLVVVLAGQLVLAGGVIALTVHGFPYFSSGPKDSDRSASAVIPASTAHRFDAGYAYRLTARQVSYGQRPAGSPQLRRLAVVLRGLMPHGRFEDLPGEPGLRNVIGTVPGRKPAIVIGAHYDTLVKPAGFVGANNGASGSAIVIELARALAATKRPSGAREVDFVLFDGEEPAAGLPEEQTDFYDSGLRGSRAYVKAHLGATHAMLLLDYVGNKGLRLPHEGSSDPSLWARVRAAAKAVGVQRVFPDRTDVTITDDDTPFQRAGVPAVDFIDWSYPGHTLQDGMSQISTLALDAVGETVMQYLRSAA